MKKIIISLIMISFIILGCGKNDFEKEILFQGKFFEDYVSGEYEVINSYDDYKKIFNNVFDEVENKINKEDFKSNKYLVFKMYYDYCVKNDVKVDSYSIKEGIVTINTKYTLKCSSCIEMDNYDYYLLKLPKSFDVKDIKIHEDVTESKTCKENNNY